MNLVSLLDEWVKKTPDVAAIIDVKDGCDRILTFKQLEEKIAACAGKLRASGIKTGDPILVFQPMSAELYIVLLALLRLGAVAVFLDPSAGKEHLERCCAMLPPKALIAIPKAFLLCLSSQAIRQIPRKFSTGGWIPFACQMFGGKNASVHENVPVSDATAALVTFTSGSTGLPKGAVRTHGLLLAQYAALRPAIALESGIVGLETLPIFALANLAAGMTTVIPDADLRKPGAIDPVPVLRQIRRLHVTRCTGSPAFFECLLVAPDAEKGALIGLKRIYTGGAPVFPDLLQRLKDVSQELIPVAVYGSTEAEPIAHVALEAISADDMLKMKSGWGLLAGETVPELSLRLDKRDGEDWGEILVSGNHVLKTYLNGIGDEETKIHENGSIWHRTGDAGRMDATGRLWLLGRVSAVIRDERGTIHPFAVESAARQFSWLRRTALLAWEGKRIFVIEGEKEPTEEQINQLKSILNWAELDEIRYLKKIPVDKRHNAKIDYPALRALL